MVEYCLAHAGHTVDIAKLPLSQAEQQYIGQLITNGKHTVSTALDFLRSSQIPDMPRLSFITRQDIRYSNFSTSWHIITIIVKVS